MLCTLKVKKKKKCIDYLFSIVRIISMELCEHASFSSPFSADGKKLVHKVDLKLNRCTLCHDIGVTQR